MLRHVAAFEFRYQAKSPVFWVGCLLFFLLTFGSVVVDTIQIGGRGNVNVNSPYAILLTLTTMSVFAIFIVVALVANVVIRDDETGFAPILRSTQLSRTDYLLGRFSGAIAAALIVFAMMPLAIAVGSCMPWLDADKVGPFHLGHYLYALFLFGFPTLLIMGALFFSVATLTRSLMWTYVTAVALLVLYAVMINLFRDPRHDMVVALADPFGIGTLEVVTKYWTATERNQWLPPMTGLLLANRVLWLGVGTVVYAIAHRLFRFEDRATGRIGAVAPAAVAEAVRAPARTPQVIVSRDGRMGLRQLWALIQLDVGFVLRSPAFFVLLGIGLLNAGASLWYAGEFYDSPSYPATRLMVGALNGTFTIIPLIIAIYYAGELVWRDRDRRVHEIVDSTAAPDWAHLIPKIVGIVVVLTAVSLVGVAGGVIIQLIKGYTHLEPVAYLLWFVLPITIFAVQLAVLAVFVQVLVPQKFLGWGVMLLYVVAQVAAASTGFEHGLYNYGDSSPVPLSDMNGMGRFWIGRAWFQIYWTAFATILGVASFALWRRGTTVELGARLRVARWRLRGVPSIVLGAATAVTIFVGAYIFYNTNVLNRYLPQPDQERRLADLEKELLRYEKVPQPTILSVRLNVDIYPKQARALTRGVYEIQNRTAAPIGEVHLRWDARLRLNALALSGARLAHDYPKYHYAIYRLDVPLAPGERRSLGFTTTLEERGFPNRDPLTRIVENGTFVDSSEISPFLGMSRDFLLKDRAKRRKYGLVPDLRPPKLEDESARAHNGMRVDSDWVTADITVSTDADQVPVAPGYVVRDSIEHGRRTVEFRTDAPINHFYSIQSARYAIARDKWQGVELAVYYHPGHEYNVPQMLAAMRASLELFSKAFSPYQFHQARILEFPSYADFAQSFANTIPYSENLGFIAHHTDPAQIDLVTYVTAHEIAHQWWGHQLTPADQQGASMLVESFAQYSALLVMEQMYGRDQVRRFLKYELDRYLRRRGGEVVEELPLARVEDQGYIHYQKGTLAMYWLREAVGRDVVDRALRRLLQEYAFKPAPYPNSLDFLRLLRAEAGPQHDALITDLFERITLVDVKATDAKSHRLPDGRYEVSFTVEARKLYADGQGKETEAPLDEPFEVGAFAAKPGDADFGSNSVLGFERRAVRSGRQTVTLVVSREPTWIGVDPYNKRIDRNSDDNLGKVAQH